MSGGYDDGYRQCDCFWGTEPSSFARLLMSHLKTMQDLKILDAGCGEGKNAAFLADMGASVDAIDVSELAVRNGRRQWNGTKQINWRVADLRDVVLPIEYYDVVIAYGLLHCLPNKDTISNVLSQLQSATVPFGYNVICAFNARFQELDAHPGFQPCLLDHCDYVMAYSSWQLFAAADQDLTERHPHNGVEHTHSLTRILARKGER